MKIFTRAGKAFALLICFLIIAITSFSQTIAQYAFSTAANGSLVLDRSGNTVDMSTGTTQLVAASQDDGVSAVTNIGFPFTFMSNGGTTNVFTQFSASSNGLIRLGGTAVLSNTYGNGFPPSGQAVIAPYLQDLKTGSAGKVHYKLIGTYPNRTLVIEFLNMNINYGSSTADGTFQARLYEQTNVIEFVYGAMKVGSITNVNSSSNAEARNVSIGFSNTTTSGNTGTYYVNQSTYAFSTSTAIVNNNNATGTITGLNSSADGSRRIFTFIPTVDYKSQFLSMSTGSTTWCAGETRTITVRVKNIGLQSWTSGSSGVNFSYWWSNQGQDANPRIYPFTTALTSGNDQLISFTATAPSTGGSFTLNFDLVKEGACWFRDNVANCSGPGNILYTSASQTVVTPASVTGQPASQTTCAGTAKTFTVTATGTSPTYQWQYSADGSTNWNNVVNGTPANITYTNAATASLTVTPSAGAAGGTYYYRCVVSVSGCSTPATSNAASLLVYATPTSANAGPDQTICSTQPNTALAANAPTVGSGAWSIVSGPSTAVTQFSSTTNPSATFTPAGGAGTYILRWTVTNGSCSSADDINIVVNAAPSVTGQPASQTTCAGTAKTFTVTATGTNPTYQWQYSADGSTNWNNVVNGTPANITYTNATTASLTVTPASGSASGLYYYRCVVSVANCSSQNSNAASLTVNALPTAAISYAGSPYCLNAGTAAVTRTGTAGGSYSATPSGLSINASTGAITLGSSSAGTYTVTYTFSNSSTGCTNTTTASVTLNPIPVGVSASATPNPVCAGSAVALTSLPSAAPVLLTQNFNAANGWTTTNLSSGGTSSEVASSAWLLQNDGYFYVDRTFHSNDNSRFVMTNSDAQGPNINYTWTFLTSPAFSTVGLSTCTLDFYQYYRARFFDLEASVQVSTDNGANWTVLHDYVNDGTQGISTAFAHPVLDLTPYVGYPSVRIRFEYDTFDGWYWALDNVSVTGGAIGAPFTYAWTSTPAGFTASTQNTTATPTASTTYNVKVTNSYGCAVTASTPQVTINPKPTATLSGTQTICGGSPASLSVAFTGTGPWSFSYTDGTNTYSVNNIGSNPYTLTVNPNNTTTYSLTSLSVSDGNCSGGTASGTATVTVSKKSVAPVSITSSATNNTICNGQSTTLSVSGGTLGTGAAIKWYAGGCGSGSALNTSSSATLLVSPATTTTYYARYEDPAPCGTLTTCASITITVNPTPSATVSAAAATCAPTGVSITFTGTPGAIITYNISGSQTTNGAQITLPAGTGTVSKSLSTPAGAGTYTYTITAVTSPAGCTGATGSTATATVNPSPSVSPISGNNYVATGSTVQLSDATAGGNWFISNTAYANFATGYTATSNPVVLRGIAAGSPTVTYTTAANQYGCTGSTSITLTVYDPSIARYRSIQDGRASDASTWEELVNGAWIQNGDVPTGSSDIEIRHNVRLETADYNGTAQSKVTITSHTAGTSAIDGILTVYPGRYFQSEGTVDFGNKRVLLQSNASGTGAIGVMATPIANATNVQVERFTDGKPSAQATGSRRAWRLITSPVTGQTIHQAWQENTATSNDNPNPQYGTLITGYGFADATAAAQQGYDWTGAVTTAGIKRYQPGSANNGAGSWVALPSSGTNASLQSEPAYMLYVRGDRSVNYAGTTSTTLRSTGTLQQSQQNLSFSAGSSFVLAGNPYASAIDFGHFYSNTTSGNSALIKDQFYVWNSTIGNYGAYVLVTHDGSGANAGGYRATPAPLSGITVQEDNNYRIIPTGAGFFVTPQSTGTSGTLHFIETDKVPGQVPPVSPFRVVTQPANVRQLIVNLNLRDSASTTLADGFRAKFSADYEGNEEDNSVQKVYNFNENLNLVRAGIPHIIEARGEVKKTDTLYVKMWSVTKRNYQLQMKGDNFTSAPGIRAWLIDNYLKTKQEIELSGSVSTTDFTVNEDTLSRSSNRFMIVFENNASALPVTITKVSAQPKNGGAQVSWTVANEVNIKGYTVEKSTDGGRTFTAAGTQQAAKNNPQAAVTSYASYDATPKEGDNFYRIRIEGNDGNISYSTVVKVTIGGSSNGIQITLYPNPVREGKTNLKLSQLKEGAYLVSVYSQGGQTVYQKKVYITAAGTTQNEELLLGNALAQGSYQIKIANDKGTVLFSDQLIVAK